MKLLRFVQFLWKLSRISELFLEGLIHDKSLHDSCYVFLHVFLKRAYFSANNGTRRVSEREKFN